MTTFWSRLLDAFGPLPEPVAKAASGPGVVAMTYDVPISTIANNPQRKAREAMAAFRSPWVFTAERAVSGVASKVAWHLEDDEGETIGAPDRESSVPEQAALDFMANPVKALVRQQAWALTMRHKGLVGYTFWYLDQRDLLAGTPLQALYIRPDRMDAATDKAGNLIGWIMDGDRPNGRQPVAFTTDEIVPFRLEPPDEGHLGIGLVEAAWRKLSLSGTVDRHTEKMIASGGRLAGIISPTAEKGSFSEDEYQQIVREMRNVTDSPDAAKKALIFKVPMDFKQTAATPSQMNLPDLNRLSRDDIFAIWGVALSTVGVTSPRGLNAGNIPKFEEAATWQNAREPRLDSFREPLQTILDRWQMLGANLTLVLETPSFDDDTPLYDIAEKAKVAPLTVDERRKLVNKDPLDAKIYGALGSAMYLDQSMVPIFGVTPPQVETPEPFSAKASLPTLRARTEVTWEPRLRRAVQAFLSKQREVIVARVRERASHLAKEPRDHASWWNGPQWDRELREALLADEEQMAVGVRSKVAATLKAAGKADPLDTVRDFIRQRAGERISGINQTTRDDISRLVEQGVSAGLAPDNLAQLIGESTSFGEARAEMISRTETMLAYNDAALRTYQDFDVLEVEAVDGDFDDACAARNGKRYPVDEAYSITDHPNGTLDWIPVSPGKAEIVVGPTPAVWAGIEAIAKAASLPPVLPPVVNVAAPAPQVIVDMSVVAKAFDELRIEMMRPRTRTILKDEAGRIVGVAEE